MTARPSSATNRQVFRKRGQRESQLSASPQNGAVDTDRIQSKESPPVPLGDTLGVNITNNHAFSARQLDLSVVSLNILLATAACSILYESKMHCLALVLRLHTICDGMIAELPRRPDATQAVGPWCPGWRGSLQCSAKTAIRGDRLSLRNGGLIRAVLQAISRVRLDSRRRQRFSFAVR